MKKVYSLIAIIAVCSTVVLNAQNRVVQIMKDGNILQSYGVEQIDSIIINEVIDAPSNLTATLKGNNVLVTWDEVARATYNLYRSAEGKNYTLLANHIPANSYTDTAPMVGSNYYKVQAVVNGKESRLSDSPAIATVVDSGMESGIYLGVVSFNQSLYMQPISQLTNDTKTTYDTFIDAMTMKYGTILCYSVDEAVNALQTATLPADISTVALVTFTDGLDQGSLMITDKYDSDDDYLTAIKGRIDNETVAGQDILAYSIGLRGSDVSSEADVAKFRSTLKKLASSDENATEVNSMSEVNAKFQEIAEQLNQTRYLQTISLKMPGLSNGTRVRFTFDNVASAEYSEIYIEGTFNLRERSLTDVEYHGMTSTSGTVINGVTEGIFVTFTFKNVQTDNNTLLSKEYIDEWYLTSASSWQINSEFDKDENSDIVNEKKSAVIMLVLDCSSSLGNEFSTVQSNAKSFITTLCESSNDGGNGNNDTPTLYSTTPIDLSLAVSIDSVRYYLTQEQFQKANLNNVVVEGLTIISGSEAFIMALEDEPADAMVGDVALSLYGSRLPSRAQGVIISARWSYINAAIEAFGGTKIGGQRWIDYQGEYYRGGDYVDYTYDGGGNIGSSYLGYGYKKKVRLVKAITSTTPIEWRDPNDLTLVVEKDGVRLFVTESEYEVLSSEYTVLGVSVITGDSKFIIALDDEPADAMVGDVARSLYGSRLPNYAQGVIISARWSYINAAIEAFGGTKMDGKRWLNCQDGNYVYYAYDGGGNIGSSYLGNGYKYKVRLMINDNYDYKETNWSIGEMDGTISTIVDNRYVYTSPKYTLLDGNLAKIRFTFLESYKSSSDPTGFPYVSIAEFYLYDGKGNSIPLTEYDFYTNAQAFNEGPIANICDNNEDTYWHSSWTSGVGEYHYLEVTLPTGIDLNTFSFRWVSRDKNKYLTYIPKTVDITAFTK